MIHQPGDPIGEQVEEQVGEKVGNVVSDQRRHQMGEHQNDLVGRSVSGRRNGSVSDLNLYQVELMLTAEVMMQLASKLFEICILEIYEMYLVTLDQQFDFKSKHATDICIFMLKVFISIARNKIPLCTLVFLDASKAFDKKNHWTLFHKLINCKIPRIHVIVRLLIFWYQTQLVCI